MIFFNLSFRRFIILALLLTSNLAFAAESLDSILGNTNSTPNSSASKDFLNLSTKLAANGADGLVDQAIAGSKSYANQQGVGIAKSFLQKYFPTVELQLDMFDSNKTQSGLLLVVPLSDPKDKKIHSSCKIRFITRTIAPPLT